MSVKKKRLVESVLFSSSKPVSISEINQATNLSRNQIKTSLAELIEDYNITRKNETSMEVVKAGNKYAMQVKKQYADMDFIISKPEIESKLLKTLTLIAFHQPVKQSNLRRMIGEKVYEQVDKLVELKLIHTKKHGSTEMLTTTKLFPEYFGIESNNPNEIKNFLMKNIANKVREKE